MTSSIKKKTHIERKLRVQITSHRYGINMVIPDVIVPDGEDEEELVDSLVYKMLPSEIAADAKWIFLFGKAGQRCSYE